MPASLTARAVFLDRDGTLIVEREYLADPAGVELVPGAVDALKRLSSAGFLLVIVTNQSGIARGLYSESDFFAVQRRLDELLAIQGITISGTYYCPHHPDFSGPCECRKPGLALFRRAQAELDVNFAASFFVGDRVRDVEPAIGLGGTGILVLTGYGSDERGKVPRGILVVPDISAAAEEIVGRQAESS